MNKSDNSTSKKVNGIILSSPTNGTPYHHFYHHHHGTCQRHQQSKHLTTPVVNERMLTFLIQSKNML